MIQETAAELVFATDTNKLDNLNVSCNETCSFMADIFSRSVARDNPGGSQGRNRQRDDVRGGRRRCRRC